MKQEVKVTIANFYTDDNGSKFIVLHISEYENSVVSAVYSIKEIGEVSNFKKIKVDLEHIVAASEALMCDIPYSFTTNMSASNTFHYIVSFVENFIIDSRKSGINCILQVLQPIHHGER
jgi:preprotein translocase subunit Sec63